MEAREVAEAVALGALEDLGLDPGRQRKVLRRGQRSIERDAQPADPVEAALVARHEGRVGLMRIFHQLHGGEGTRETVEVADIVEQQAEAGLVIEWGAEPALQRGGRAVAVHTPAVEGRVVHRRHAARAPHRESHAPLLAVDTSFVYLASASRTRRWL